MKPNCKTGLILAALAVMQSAEAQIMLTDFEEFATSSGNGSVLFRQPSFSGSTATRVAGGANISQVVDNAPGNTSHSLNISFSFATGFTDPWLRLTTSTATGAQIPNPIVDLTQNLSFNMYTDRPLSIALGIRETDSSGAIGANGGTSGTIEFVGANTKNGAAPIPFRTIPAGQWTTVAFDIDGEEAVGFTGNGVINLGANGKGVMEHLALVPADGLGAYNLYFDNFQITPVPEPGTYATLFGLGLAGFAGYRRFKRK